MDQATIKRHLDALAKLDPDLQHGLEIVGYPAPRIRVQGFETFLSTIVSQQISTEAATSIMHRVRALLPGMEAQDVLRLPEGALRAAGLSGRKVEYVEGLALAMVERRTVWTEGQRVYIHIFHDEAVRPKDGRGEISFEGRVDGVGIAAGLDVDLRHDHERGERLERVDTSMTIEVVPPRRVLAGRSYLIFRGRGQDFPDVAVGQGGVDR